MGLIKFLVTISLLVTSINVMAEWTAVAGNSHYTTYIDTDSRQIQGDRVTIWYMFDYSSVQKRDGSNQMFNSSVMQGDFNCKKQYKRQLDVILYSENLARGSVVHAVRNINEKYISIIPGSMDAGLIKWACY